MKTTDQGAALCQMKMDESGKSQLDCDDSSAETVQILIS
jgi:hypothetical protein